MERFLTTELAGDTVAHQMNEGPGTVVFLTPEQADIELDAGTVVYEDPAAEARDIAIRQAAMDAAGWAAQGAAEEADRKAEAEAEAAAQAEADRIEAERLEAERAAEEAAAQAAALAKLKGK